MSIRHRLLRCFTRCSQGWSGSVSNSFLPSGRTYRSFLAFPRGRGLTTEE